MSWSRFDDNWTRKIQSLGISYPARWHYMAMIQTCSATNRYDGRMLPAEARSCSDVEDPMGCLAELERIGLVTRDTSSDGERYIVIDIADHVPPPHLRDKKRKADQVTRQHRSRAHKAGDHSLCLPGKCPEAEVTSEVTRDIGTVTGQDGPGLREVVDTVTGEIHAHSATPPLPGPRSSGSSPYGALCDCCGVPPDQCVGGVDGVALTADGYYRSGAGLTDPWAS